MVTVCAVPPVGIVAFVLACSSVGVDTRTVTPTWAVTAVFAATVPGTEAVPGAMTVIGVVTATGAAILPRAVASFVLVAVWAVVLSKGAAAATEAGVTVGAAAGV